MNSFKLSISYRFVEIAESGKTNLSRAMFVYGLEPQSEDFVRITFSEAVEDCLVERGHNKEATFCRLVRNWNRANDEAGMSVLQRIEHRLRFKNWLLDGILFGSFPR